MALPVYTPTQRREMAQTLGIDEQYVYQVFAGIKTASPALARQIHALDPTAPLHDLRPDDWHRIWPELIGAEGAPAVVTPAAQEAA